MAFVDERVRMFGITSHPLGDMDVVVKRTYLLNDEGSAEFLISIYDDKCTPEFIKLGNRVLVQNEKLPDWVGIINRIEWNDFFLRVECKSAARLLKWRRGINGLKLTGTAGEIYKHIISLANLSHATEMRRGKIYIDGHQREETLGTDDLFKHVQRVSSRSRDDWDITPAVTADGSLELLANWYDKQGVTRLIPIEQGNNIRLQNPIKTEDGDAIINDLLGYNQAATPASRIEFVLEDKRSAARYGWRQGALSFNVKNMGSLQSAVRSQLSQRKWSKQTYRATMLDVSDLFSHLRLGDTFPLSLYRTGFSAGGLGTNLNIRILGMSYDPLDPSQMPVVVEKVNVS